MLFFGLSSTLHFRSVRDTEQIEAEMRAKIRAEYILSNGVTVADLEQLLEQLLEKIMEWQSFEEKILLDLTGLKYGHLPLLVQNEKFQNILHQLTTWYILSPLDLKYLIPSDSIKSLHFSCVNEEQELIELLENLDKFPNLTQLSLNPFVTLVRNFKRTLSLVLPWIINNTQITIIDLVPTGVDRFRHEIMADNPQLQNIIDSTIAELAEELPIVQAPDDRIIIERDNLFLTKSATKI